MRLLIIVYSFIGECNRENCRLLHEQSSESSGAFTNFGSSGRQGSGSYGASRTSSASGTCYAFQRGECDRGDACRFSHEAVGDAPASFSSGPKPCFQFQKGNCDRGDTCKYSHVVGASEQEGYAGYN